MTILASVGVVVGTLAVPAQAGVTEVAAGLSVAKTATVPLDGKCLRLPVAIQPPTGVTRWNVDLDVTNAATGYTYGLDDSAASYRLQHCAGLYGVGRFEWSATLEWSDSATDSEGSQTFTGSYTIGKAKRTGTLKISDRTPRFGQRVTFKVCVPGPRYVSYKLQGKVGKQTASRSFSSGATGCTTTKLKWPKYKRPVQYRLSIPGSETVKPYTGKWVTVRGHA